jgi:calcineurin-like phosphoesterase family protein
MLSGFPCYALVIDDARKSSDSDRLSTLAAYLAYDSGKQCLVLMPYIKFRSHITVLDPLPAFAAAADHIDEWPGLAIWTNRALVFASLRTAERLVPILLSRLHAGDLEGVDKLLSEAGSDTRTSRILHLSDLHFGSEHALRNLGLLEAELHDVVQRVDRVVITGDLFDNPTVTAARAFDNFRLSLERMARRPIVAVPGNHDQRLMGNFGRDFLEIARLSWMRHEVDPDSHCVFLGFNSSEAGSFARGQITKDQLERLAAQHRNQLAMRPDTRDLLRVAVVHHHPFSFSGPPQSFVGKALLRLGWSEEIFLKMKDAGRFLRWCAAWDVPLILHGHKHVPRHHREKIDSRSLTAVGCGSSLGMGGTPPSYNVLAWSSLKRRWCVSFFSSTDAGPFVREYVSISGSSEMGDDV